MLAPGSRVDSFEVTRLVAAGAMCHVYEAHNSHSGRPVAVKVLRGDWCSEEEIVTRFLNEATILRTIRHPHVVSLLASGTLQDGAPYMVLEWLPKNLARSIADAGGPLPSSAASRLALQIARALAALHAHGIVHRDLKPANVLLDRVDLAEAQVRLADLGLAKARPDPRAEAPALRHVSTGGGATLGTWDYMAPEQWIKSKTAGPAADVYSLGVLLFQMLAGTLPFVAEQAKALMTLHLLEPAPVGRLPEGTPSALRELLGGMLAKSAPDRPGLDQVLGTLQDIGQGFGARGPGAGA